MAKTAPTIDDLRQAIPSHCFKSSTLRSLRYLARDLTLIGALAIIGNQIPAIASTTARILLWTVYGWLQGLLFTGIWILAHECGHGSFSDSDVLNDCLGWLLHSSLLVPYFSWRLSHQRHHMYNAHMDKDTAHVPARREEIATSTTGSNHSHLSEDTPIWSALRLISHQLFGLPLYFLFYLTAGNDATIKKAQQTWYNASHFGPWSIVFRSNNWKQIVMSDLGLVMTLAGLQLAATYLSWSRVLLLYGVPYLWVNHWIVAITLLHHTHSQVPRYEADSWTYLDGALATVDRDYGFIGKHVFHNIIDYHVIHHLFPRIPFYHAAEATAAISPLLGDRLVRERGSFHVELWKTFRELKWVEAREDPAGRGTIRVWNTI